MIAWGDPGTGVRPRLVLGIVVDQMRFDQLYRYQARLSKGGLARLLENGFSFTNAHINSIPTVTAPGHASIYTGTTPSIHGIIGNSWYERSSRREVDNVSDSTVRLVGPSGRELTGYSPHRLLTTTFGDEMRLHTNFRSKVISVSLKDRGAVLPGGRLASAAYWFDWRSTPGNFVSSSYYLDSLPRWVTTFNGEGRSNKILNSVWSTLFPIDTYVRSAPDDQPSEKVLRGKDHPTFPYDLPRLRTIYRDLGAEYQLVWISPGGNSLLTEFAMAAVTEEQLGMDEETDLLAISYSVPDVAGHTFGLQSIELEDIYLRLDRDIAAMLTFLDRTVGEGRYTVFLTSDHAASLPGSYVQDQRLAAKVIPVPAYVDSLRGFLRRSFGEKPWIERFDGEQVYLDHTAISESGVELEEIRHETAQYLRTLDGIYGCMTADDLLSTEYQEGLRRSLQLGYHPRRSGDVLVLLDPGAFRSSTNGIRLADLKGSTHGSGYAYDTHIPMVWYGWHIPQGTSARRVHVIDIAPTIAAFLHLQQPSGATGEPMLELWGSPE